MADLWHTASMRKPIILIVLFCAALGGPVLAEEPAPATSTGVTAAPSDPAQAPAAAATATASADATKATADAAAEARAKETDKRLRNQGYKPAVRNGVTYYCRNQPQLGSHFETRVCSTPEDLERMALDSKEVTEKMQFIRTQQAK